MKRTLITMAVLLAAIVSTRAQISQWIAYNDHYRGTFTAPNVSSWNAFTNLGGAPGRSGPLTNFITGAVLPVSMSISNLTNGFTGGTAAGTPSPGTPAAVMFTNIVDFGSGTLNHAIQLAGASRIVHTFSGLDPARLYSWHGTAVRANNYTNRWTIVEIGAASFTGASTLGTTGLWTSVEIPSLTTAQVVANFGENRSLGVVAGWTNITPNADGTIHIYQNTYRGPLPAGFFFDTGNYGYAIAADRLEEFSSTGVATNIAVTTPANGATFSLGASITVSANPTLGNPVTNVAFFHDGILIGNDTTAPYSVVYSNAPLGAHTFTATAQDNTGGSLTSTNVVQITVVPNTAPTVNITSPINGSNYLVGVNIAGITAAASDADGIAAVEFYLDGGLWAMDTTSPYSFDLCDVTAGTHTISAVAIDSLSARATNSISIVATNRPGVSIIVSNGSTWKYLDNGSDQGTAWHALGFDDSAWSSGAGELGYGDGPARPERTLVGFGPNTNAKYPTTYFRKTFNVSDPNAFSSLTLNVLADDHFVAYLNGTQVFSDMTNAIINFSTYESPAVAHDGANYTNATLSASLLTAGANILAIEVHQDTTNSSDISFDAMLWGTVPSGPTITFRRLNATQADIAWPLATDPAFALEFKADLNAASWSPEPGIDNPSGGFHHITVSTGVGSRFWHLKKP